MVLGLGVRPVPSQVPPVLQPSAGLGEGLEAVRADTERHSLTLLPSLIAPKAPCLEEARCGECLCSCSYCKTALKKDGQLWGRAHVPACHHLPQPAPGPGPGVDYPQKKESGFTESPKDS